MTPRPTELWAEIPLSRLLLSKREMRLEFHLAGLRIPVRTNLSFSIAQRLLCHLQGNISSDISQVEYLFLYRFAVLRLGQACWPSCFVIRPENTA